MASFTNKSPWNSEALIRCFQPFLSPETEEVEFTTHRPQPGVERKQQDVFGVWETKSRLRAIEVALPSPARVKATQGLLDRLSQSDSLQPHEVMLPAALIAKVGHALKELQSSRSGWSSLCLLGKCSCSLPLREVSVPGSLKERVRPAKTLDQLERELRYLQHEVRRAEEVLAEKQRKAGRLAARVERMKAGRPPQEEAPTPDVSDE